jgi:hypothetical protein
MTTAPSWELSSDKRRWHLAIAWRIALLPSVFNQHGNLFATILYFPVSAYILLGLAGLPLGFVSAARLGWIVYISLSWAILMARKRFLYYGLYVLLCLLLLLSVIACFAPS